MVSSILNEPDKDFIKKNLDPIEMKDLFDTIQAVNSKGIPANKKKALLKKRLSEQA